MDPNESGSVPIRRLLVANRGEIALRIVRACRDLGIESVVAFSEADRGSLPVRLADRAVCIGPGPATASYLHGDTLLAAAIGVGADAIHPGYGFLSERAEFAEACERSGLVFVGPGPEAMRSLGDKARACALARTLGVPTVPGVSDERDPTVLARRCADIGYPLLVKASAGGGGRGMRIVRAGEELSGALTEAAAEAQAAFGDPTLYVEKRIENARHVEVQVLFDAHGRGVNLGERDCTVQRRYQKLIEEAPSPALDASQRAALGTYAMRLADAAGYRGAGTVEFLIDQATGAVYFIEVNARLQVEHPVTELVTGRDLVALQLQLAGGLPLPIRQDDVELRGHAIEFRINAEDPADAFRPRTGTVGRLHLPAGPGVRVDSHVSSGAEVTPFYDSLLAKVIVWGEDRPQALARARRALAETEIDGVPTTLAFHRWVVDHPAFVASTVSTTWVDVTWPSAAGS